jgi:hypothetical protein
MNLIVKWIAPLLFYKLRRESSEPGSDPVEKIPSSFWFKARIWGWKKQSKGVH